MEHYIKKTRLPVSAQRLFDWHLGDQAFERLTPPWERVRVVDRGQGVTNGSRIKLALQMGPLRLMWISEHRNVIAGLQFEDFQIKGPFSYWLHRHLFQPDGADCCWMVDEVDYRLPGGKLGQWLGGGHTRRKLEKMFQYRHEVLGKTFGLRSGDSSH